MIFLGSFWLISMIFKACCVTAEFSAKSWKLLPPALLVDIITYLLHYFEVYKRNIWEIVINWTSGLTIIINIVKKSFKDLFNFLAQAKK